MTIDLTNLPAIGQTFTAGGKTLRLNSIVQSLQQGKMYDFTEIGKRGAPKKVTYITTDARKGFCTMVRI